MKINLVKDFDTKADVLFLGVFDDLKQIENKELIDEINYAISIKSFEFEFGKTYSTKITNSLYKRILVISLGKKEEVTTEKVRRAMSKGIEFLKATKLESFTTNILNLVPNQENARAAAEGLVLSSYAFHKYLNNSKKKFNIKSVSLIAPSELIKNIQEGEIIANSTNYVKDLVNEPANVINPETIEKEVLKLKSKNIVIKILRKKDLEKEGLGALLGVGKGSNIEPRLIFIHYNNNPKEKITAIVGKGITFDSGGYDIKPAGQFVDMKCDMSGAGAVLGTIKAISELGLKRNVLGVIATTENLINGLAQKPGDIVKAYNGKTIEIMNTDAEGRLILADAISYTEKNYSPETIIDLATLTGACVIALGYYASGLVSNDEELSKKLVEAGYNSYDRVWPLPFFEEYRDNMDGDISDLKNMSTKGKGREAGAITAAVFISKFVEKSKWAHIDIAGPAYLAEAKDYNQKYASGAGVRLLSYYFMK